MRLRGPVLVAAVVLGVAAPASQAGPPFPPPPSFAFRDASLDRPLHTIDVHMQAVTDIGVVVHVVRNGVRIGRQEAMVHPGQTTIPVRIGPHALRRLRPGLYVTVAIYFGAVQPLRIRTKLLLAQAPVA